jgi:hypothetical protein
MKKRLINQSANLPGRIPVLLSNKKEREAFRSSVRQLDEQSDRLSILDPLETEPAILYSPTEEEK